MYNLLYAWVNVPQGTLGVMHGTKCVIAIVTCDNDREVCKGGTKHPKNS
jgi:hypothetical protein